MRQIRVLMLLVLSAPVAAQELPRPTEAGGKSLDKLIRRCIASGGLKEVRDPATGDVTLAEGDPERLRATVEPDAATEPALRDALLARFGDMNARQNPALVSLLRALGEVADDDRARAFVALARASQEVGREDYAAAMRQYREARRCFEKLGDSAWGAYTLDSLAAVHWAVNQTQEALDLLERSLELTRKAQGKRAINVAHCLWHLGLVYGQLNRHEEALRRLQEALAIARESEGQEDLVANCLDHIAGTYRNLEDYPNALEFARRGLALRERLNPGDESLAGSHNTLGTLHADLGEYAEALRQLLTSLEILRKYHPERSGPVAIAHNNLGSVYSSIGDYRRSLDQYRQAESIFRSIFPERHSSVAMAYNNLANALYHLGEFGRAIEYHEKALRIRRSLSGERGADVADSLSDLGSLYQDRGDYSEALKAQRLALEIRIERLGPRHPRIAVSRNNLGSLYLETREYAKAVEEFEAALAIWRRARGDKHPEVGTVLNNIGGVFKTRGEYGKAIGEFEKALAVRRSALGDRHPLIAQTLHNIGSCHESLGRTGEALEYYRLALSALRVGADPLPSEPDRLTADRLRPLPLTVTILRDRGRAMATELGEGDDAARVRRCLRANRLAEDMFDLVRGRVVETESSKLALAERGSELAARLVDLGSRLSRTEGTPEGLKVAYAAFERGTAQVFLEGLGRSRARVAGGVPAELLAEEAGLLAQTRELDSRIDRDQALPAERRDAKRVNQLMAERRLREERLRGLIERMERDYPRYAALKYPKPCTIEEARSCLADDEVALLYALGKTCSYLIVVQKRDDPKTAGLDVHRLPPADDIADLVATLTSEKVLADDGKVREQGARAYAMLLAPAAMAIREKGLVIVPGRSLGYLPFELLVEPAAGGGTGRRDDHSRYLVEGHRIRYAPSLTALHITSAWETTRPKPERLLWAMGDPVYQPSDPRLKAPARASEGTRFAVVERGGGEGGVAFERLPASGEEIERLRDLVGPAETVALLGVAAKEAAVKRASGDGLLAKYRYIHFATHGVLGLADGTQPALVLSLPVDQEGEDGLLQLDEVTGLRLNADLVVLSACQSGRGRLSDAEGVRGLARAFIYAGSRAVLCSLWRVSDRQACDLMVDIYATLGAGRPPADALRAAQIKMIESGEPPLFWAPFILIGR
jgi:CHAT domain-containing protein/tetratricopeptide (TPR) repeat protein